MPAIPVLPATQGVMSGADSRTLNSGNGAGGVKGPIERVT